MSDIGSDGVHQLRRDLERDIGRLVAAAGVGRRLAARVIDGLLVTAIVASVVSATPSTSAAQGIDLGRLNERLAKLDVKTNAQRRLGELKDSATTDSGTPRPEVLAAAGSLVAMAVVLLLWRRRH